MIYPFGPMMGDKERGRLFSIQMDGSDSVPFIIKKDKLLIGRGDSCEIRIYVEGVSPEHCVITFNEEGRGFVEPVNKCGLTFLNGELIERQVSLEHNDVITIVKRSFRFFYPSSSKFYVALKPVTSSEENIVVEHLDFEPEDAYGKSGKEIPEKRVTFGPRLSPEEFDKNMPPASPLRKGSLPADKLKAKTPDTQKSHSKRALFNDNPMPSSPSTRAERISAGKQLPRSTVVLHKLRCINSADIQGQCSQPEKETNSSKPLFSDVLKKSVVIPPKNIVNKPLQKYSPKRLTKKAINLQNTKKAFFKSPRRPIHPRVLAVGSTGHANSPETIVIYKKRIAPSRNSVSSVKKRKSLRLLRGSLSSRKSIPEKKGEHLESPNSTAVNTSLFTSHSDSFHGVSDSNNNNQAAFPENSSPLCEAHDKSTPKQKSNRSYNEDDSTPVQEKDTNEKQSCVSPLAVAIDSVAQLDENSIDKSLKDIHNAVQALACHSNVSSALSNDPSSSADMCMNAVKKLALTISMVNAFHMYRRIIDDVSGFPLCFPSTSFDSNRENMKCVQRSGAHQSDDPLDIARLSWFQDIMRNFFSNSIRNDVYDGGRKCMLRSCENDLCPEVTSMCNNQNRKSKFASTNKVALKAIDSGCKNPKCKSVCIEHEDGDGVFSESDEMHEANTSVNRNECGSCSECTPVRSSCCENSHRMSTTESNKNLNFSGTPSRHSLSSQEYCSYHSPSPVQNLENHELSTTEDVILQRSRKSLASNSSFEKVVEKLEEVVSENKRKRSSVESNKSWHSPVKNTKMKFTSNMCSRRSRKTASVASKPQKVPLVAKKRGITTSKKMKEQKKIHRHRLSVLKKVNFKPKSQKMEIETSEQALKAPSSSLKRQSKQNTLLKAKQIKVGQKLVKQAKSRASKSPSAYPNDKITNSPKLLRKKNDKRKSVVFKSMGLRGKKSDFPVKNSSRRKSIVVNTSPRKQLPKSTRGIKSKNKSENVKIACNNDVKTRPATKSRNTKKKLEKSGEVSDIKKLKSRRNYSDGTNEDKDTDSSKNITEATPTRKSRNTRKKVLKKTKASDVKKEQRNKEVYSLVNNKKDLVNSLDVNIADEDTEATPARNTRKKIAKNAKASGGKKTQRGIKAHSLVNGENDHVDALDINIGDHHNDIETTPTKITRKGHARNAKASNIKKTQGDKKAHLLVNDENNFMDTLDTSIGDHHNDIEATPTRITRKGHARNAKASNIKKNQGGKKAHLLVNDENNFMDTLDTSIVDRDTDATPAQISRNTRKKPVKNAKVSDVKVKKGGKREGSFVNNEDELVDSLDVITGDEFVRKDISLRKRPGRYMKDAEQVSLAAIKKTRNLRKKDNSQNSGKELLKKGANDSTLASENESSAVKTQSGKRNVKSSEKNNEVTSEKTETTVLREVTKNSASRTARSKRTRADVTDTESNEVVETSEKTEGTVLKEVTKNSASRTARSKRIRADVFGAESTEVVAKVSQKQNMRGKNKSKREIPDNTRNCIEESSYSKENDGSANLSQTERGKRKKASEIENEIPVKTARKDIKLKPRRRSIDQCLLDEAKKTNALIEESTTVIDPQRKRGKRNAGDENVPKSASKKTKSKKSPVESPKQKINQTEVTKRTLRSRK